MNQKSIHKFTQKLPIRKSVPTLEEEIFNINSQTVFNEVALKVFNFQYNNNPVYQSWVNYLNVQPSGVKNIEQIPFLPIEVFKNSQVISSPVNAQTVVFKSSSTTSQTPSKHYVNKAEVYEKSFLKGFELFYGKPAEYCFLALLPNYLERKDSSLVYMFNRLIKESGHALSGFFKENIDELINVIEKLKAGNQKVLIVGVSYALLDLCEKLKLNGNFIVMETGGMKGRRKELLKEELHATLKQGFGLTEIHSEYGMTEMLSQAYSQGDMLYSAPPWMKFLIREVTDPLKLRTDDKTGGINVIDLANVYSCSFIATQDLGRLLGQGRVELMGRYDNSDVRGCNLMMES